MVVRLDLGASPVSSPTEGLRSCRFRLPSSIRSARAACCLRAARRMAPPAPAPPRPAAYPFTFETLLEDAKHRAADPITPQRSSLPSALDKLSPEQYRSIHFNPDAGIWRAENLPFRLELLRAAHNLPTAVTVSTVDDGMAHGRGRHTGHVSNGRRPAGRWARCRCRFRASGSAAASTRIRSGTSSWFSRARATFARWPRISCTGCRRGDWQSTPANRRARSFRRSPIFGSSARVPGPTPSSSMHCSKAYPPQARTNSRCSREWRR